jgi:hypothetical protein
MRTPSGLRLQADHRVGLERDLVPVLAGNRAAEGERFERVAQSGRRAVGCIAEVLDRLVVPRIPSRPVLGARDERRARVNGSCGPEAGKNLAPVDPRLLTGFDGAPEDIDGTLHRPVQILARVERDIIAHACCATMLVHIRQMPDTRGPRTARTIQSAPYWRYISRILAKTRSVPLQAKFGSLRTDFDGRERFALADEEQNRCR